MTLYQSKTDQGLRRQDVPSAHGTEAAETATLRGDLAACEQRVLRQFVEALLFEAIVEYRITARDPQDPIYKDDEKLYDLIVDFRLGQEVYRCLGARKSFSRIRIADASILKMTGARGSEPASLLKLVDELKLPRATQERLSAELSQTVEVSQWNRKMLAHHLEPRRGASCSELESKIIEGHLYHPCFKTRLGFSLRDHASYGSEAENTFQLEWLAVKRDDLNSSLPRGEAQFWSEELGSSEYARLLASLQEQAGSVEGHALVPLHPFQKRSVGALGLDYLVRAGDAFFLGPAGDRYRATQSLRTLVNATNSRKANVKLALNIVCTSSHRNLQKHFVCTAPPLSNWLESLVSTDPYLQDGQRLILLKEYAALLFEPENKARGERAKRVAGLEEKIGAIFRESIESQLSPGESAVPFTALMLTESDRRPFIADWIDAHGLESWVERLIEVMLIPIWHMLVHHGIAFEAHAQNLILVHRDGWPDKIALRDFHEDTEFVQDYLARPDLVPAFEKLDPFFATIPDDDGYRMSSVEGIRELFMDTVYVFNLAELAFLLERHFALSEKKFWHIVRTRLLSYEHSGVTDKTRIDRVGCGQAEIVVESLLTKKLKGGGVLDYFEHRIENTLRECV